jgi:hypothetical protein
MPSRAVRHRPVEVSGRATWRSIAPRAWRAVVLSSELTIVIPAYDEAATLDSALPEVLQLCEDRGFRLILVDDGSTDGTAGVAGRHAGHEALLVVTNKVNRGYGGAIKAGIAQANTEFVMTMDADGQHRLGDVTRLYDEILARDADMVIGARRPTSRESRYRRIGKSLIRTVAKLLLPVRIRDLNSGMRIMRTGLAKRYLHLCPDSMAFSDTFTLVFVSQRHLVTEVPIEVGQRRDGTSKVSTMTAVDTVREIINIVVLFNPMRIFLPLSLFLVVGGVAWGATAIALYGRGVSVGAMLAVVSGLIVFFLALIAEQLSALRRSHSPYEP